MPDSPAIPPSPQEITGPGLSDIAEFAQESSAAQAECHLWLKIIAGINNAAHGSKNKTMAALADTHGFTLRQVRRKYEAYRVAPTWQTLVDRRKFPKPGDHKLHPSFCSYIKTLVEDHQRANSLKAGWNDLKTQWRTWLKTADPQYAIPGYKTPPPANPFNNNLPNGWSYRHFCRIAKTSDYDKTLRSQGRFRASLQLPSVRTTRHGLKYGEIIYFDDSWHDTDVNFIGVNKDKFRPLAFYSMEALSGSVLEMGLKPQVYDEAAAIRRELTEIDFFWFVMLILTKHGYRTDTKTTLIFEHGTANTRIDEMLSQYTGGKVVIDRSGRDNKPHLNGMLFEGKPGGNFRFKAPLESFFNLVRNRSDALPGATGKDRDHAPSESYGLGNYNRRLLKLIDKLPAHQFAKLRLPVIEWSVYRELAWRINEDLNNRTEHSLEGWEKCGFTETRFRLPGAGEGGNDIWIDPDQYAQLPEVTRQVVDSLAPLPGNTHTARWSPARVQRQHAHELTRLPMAAVPIIAPERAWTTVRLSSQHEFLIQNREIDSDIMTFRGIVRNAHGREEILEAKKQYLCLLNIFDPSQLWIAEKDGSRRGAFIGVSTRVQVPCKTNIEAILESLGEVNHIRAIKDHDVASRAKHHIAQRLADKEHNDNVVAGDTAETLARARKLKRIKVSDTDLAAASTNPDPEPPAHDYTIDPEEFSKIFSNP